MHHQTLRFQVRTQKKGGIGQNPPLFGASGAIPVSPISSTTMTQPTKYPPHYRMFIEDVYRDYADGLLTVKGAVFCIVAATYKFGDPVHLNVSLFLERTGIHPRSYARAVQALIEEKRLDFPPNAVQSLRVPTIKGTQQPIYYSLSTNSGQICDRGGQICPEEGQICPDHRPKFPLEAESEAPSITLSSLSFSLSSEEREEDEIERQYTEWLTKKAQQLPQPPTFLEEWLLKNRDKKSNRKEFFKYKKALNEAIVPQPAATAIFEPINEQQQRLDLLNHWWWEGAYERVETTVAAHPDWNLVVTETGVEVAT